MKVDYLVLNEAEIKKLQDDLLKLLLEVDRICRKHNIEYFIAFGTLLGAVRHQGFIPWDDDIDIEMKREEYDRFIEACETELKESNFFFQNHNTDKHYRWVYGKLKMKNTSLIRRNQEHLKQRDGIFIDIFPIDKISNNKLNQRLTFLFTTLCRKISWSVVGKKYANTWIMKKVFSVLSFLPLKPLMKVYECVVKKDRLKETEYYGFHNYYTPGLLYKAEWFESAVTLKFQGHDITAPQGYEELLTYFYDDYMTLPPVDKRQGNVEPVQIKFSNGEVIMMQDKYKE